MKHLVLNHGLIWRQMNNYEKHFSSPEKVLNYLGGSGFCYLLYLRNMSGFSCRVCDHYDACSKATSEDIKRWAMEWLLEENDN